MTAEASARLRVVCCELLEWATAIEDAMPPGTHASINAALQDMRARSDELEAALGAVPEPPLNEEHEEDHARVGQPAVIRRTGSTASTD